MIVVGQTHYRGKGFTLDPDSWETYSTLLDQALADLNETLPPLKEFIMQGGSPAAAAAHVARTGARRAERAVWALHENEPVNAPVMKVLNRLSDYLFVVARVLGRSEGAVESSWQHRRGKGEG